MAAFVLEKFRVALPCLYFEQYQGKYARLVVQATPHVTMPRFQAQVIVPTLRREQLTILQLQVSRLLPLVRPWVCTRAQACLGGTTNGAASRHGIGCLGKHDL